MKPEIIIQQGLKSANILLKNAQQRAAELDHLKGELVIITYLQPIITQYFIDNKSEIWLLFLIAHSKR